MDVKKVYAALEALDKGDSQAVDALTAKFMQDKGLITILDPVQYRNMQSDASRLDSVGRDIESYTSQISGYESQKKGLVKRLDSWLYKSFSRQSSYDSKKRELGDTEKKLEETNKGLLHSKAEKERLEQLNHDLEGYLLTREGCYIKPTSLGVKKAKQISARMERIGNESYDDFAKEIDQVYEAIAGRHEKFKGMYEFLLGKGYGRDSKVVQYAAALSSLDGTNEDIYERAGVINGYLYDKNWKSYDRLRIASAVAMQEGDIHKLKDELVSVYLMMVADNHSKSYSTWSEAAAVMKIKGQDAKSKYGRFGGMQDALNERQWRKGSPAACYVAANLSQIEGDIIEIADEFRSLEKKIVERGRNDCVESGIASLIMMNAKGGPDEKADRFNQAFETMHRYGWNKDTSNYAAAAVVATMPGTVEENVQLLSDVTEMMKAEGFRYGVTNMALPVIGAGFKDLFKVDAPPYMASSPSFSASYDSGVGFNLAWAIAGDLIDNGNIDFSGGFIAGGIAGGLLD